MFDFLKHERVTRIVTFVILSMVALWAFSINLSSSHAATAYPQNPRVTEDGDVTWDCVYFGTYPQSSDGNGGYKTEPIKWRVLSVNGDEALLLSDKNLDTHAYNDELINVTWETSSVRKWLNGSDADSFLMKAFVTDAERNSICQKTIQNPDNNFMGYDTPGGNDTRDKVFFLSFGDVLDLSYGFPNYWWNTKVREAFSTKYALRYSENSNEDISRVWCLRSPGIGSDYAACIASDGLVSFDGIIVNAKAMSVRPALYLNLKSNAWSHAKTISENFGTNVRLLKRITARKSQITYETNDKLTVGDVKVTAFYSDGSKKDITYYASSGEGDSINFKTNASQIDMSTPGTKNLIVTYEEDHPMHIVKTATIPITVTKAATAKAKAATVAKPKKITIKKVTSPKKKTLKVTWKRDSKATGYQAVIATDKKFKKNKKTATISKNKTVSKTFTKLKSKKTYYAKVRAYKKSGSKNVYSAYSKIKKVRVK